MVPESLAGWPSPPQTCVATQHLYHVLPLPAEDLRYPQEGFQRKPTSHPPPHLPLRKSQGVEALMINPLRTLRSAATSQAWALCQLTHQYPPSPGPAFSPGATPTLIFQKTGPCTPPPVGGKLTGKESPRGKAGEDSLGNKRISGNRVIARNSVTRFLGPLPCSGEKGTRAQGL